MRLIDADKLIPTTLTDGGYWTKEVFYRRDIDNAPTVTPESPQWISVKDKLPEDERDVLAYYGYDHGNGDCGVRFTGILTYFAFDPRPHWQYEDVGLRVTHWIPLPEPPGMGKGYPVFIPGERKNAPADDVEPVRPGKWIWDENAHDWGLGAFICSECRCKNNNLPDNRYNPYMFVGSRYCPNCGAKMDGEALENEP